MLCAATAASLARIADMTAGLIKIVVIVVKIMDILTGNGEEKIEMKDIINDDSLLSFLAKALGYSGVEDIFDILETGDEDKTQSYEENADNTGWRVIKTVNDLPKYSGKFIITIEEQYYTINRIHANGCRKERTSVSAWFDADSMSWEIDGVDKPIDAVEGGSIDGVLTYVVAWQTLPAPMED